MPSCGDARWIGDRHALGLDSGVVRVKHKVSELEGALLDAAVAKAEGFVVGRPTRRGGLPTWEHPSGGWLLQSEFQPSVDWRGGGSIIAREHIKLAPFSETYWEAVVYDFKREPDRWPGRGATPLIAAMRAYVASKFGEEVEL
jgi:hypothetical protein